MAPAARGAAAAGARAAADPLDPEVRAAAGVAAV